ncbi:MAG: DNA mismatch repair protein MutS [Dehalococcoidia bacterium]|nr:DNA mismatch repair protein MutS [Dehalococcoidia bacterium]
MTVTPLRKQYLRIKQRYPGTIVFFRLGDFYETFDEDARITSRELEIVLTSREMGKGQKVPLAGIPYHALDNYLAKLINRGYKVAICEQLSPPGKGLVDRDVIRVVTPGTVIEPGLLNEKNNNYLVSLFINKGQAGIAYVDITTGEFATTQISDLQVADEIGRLNPAEVIVPKSDKYKECVNIRNVTQFDDYFFDADVAAQALLEHFSVSSLEGYGCARLPLAIRAAGAILGYIRENQKIALGLLNRLSTYSTGSFMTLDMHTCRNLELFNNLRWGNPSDSLLAVIDLTKTAMGGRLLKRFLGQPLLNVNELNLRLDSVEWFYQNTLVRSSITVLLADISDMERVINRIRSNTATPRDLIALKSSLEKVDGIYSAMTANKAPEQLLCELKRCPEVVELISRSISDKPAANFDHGGIIRQGFAEELDKVRLIAMDARQFLAGLEKQERERTGIKSLKLGYNRVFGYYIEVSQANLNLVPQDYIRRQTLANGERYYTPQLKEYESLILNAQERMVELEKSLFNQVCQQIALSGERTLATSAAVANIDVFSGLAEIATRNGYVRPELNEEDAIVIRGGRHPVVENALGKGIFVPNDTYLANKDTQLIVLTGPNMAGKSTYLKQVALIVLLAQIGSFVPADSAVIGIVDRIFTRIGAQEDIAAGQSTFMVEMIEVANILNNATAKSLLILDEVGRGTSTYDGLSIAWAVVEYIHNNTKLRAKTLFATHYHELIELATLLPRVKNFNVAVTEEKGKVIFLRKVIHGGADKSYGIHVAQLAGLPRAVVHRSEEILDDLERNQNKKGEIKNKADNQSLQLSIFGKQSEIEQEINTLNIDEMTPIDAINKLYELKKRAKRNAE